MKIAKLGNTIFAVAVGGTVLQVIVPMPKHDAEAFCRGGYVDRCLARSPYPRNAPAMPEVKIETSAMTTSDSANVVSSFTIPFEI